MSVRERLLGGYVLLGAALTGIGAVGARSIYAEVEARAAERSAVIRDIKWLAATGSSAAEESFSYVLSGDLGERRSATNKFDDLCSAARQLHGEVAALEVPDGLAQSVQLDACRLGEVGQALFASYEADGVVAHAEYHGFENAEDTLAEHVFELDLQLDRASNEDRAMTARTTDALMVVLGFVGVLIAVLTGRRMADSVAGPLTKLRDALRSFGSGNLDATVEVRSIDELGQLASAFREMASDVREHLHARDAAHDRLNDIFGSMEELLVVCDESGAISAANRACLELTGYEESQLIGRHASELFADLLAPTAHVDGAQLPGTRLHGESTLHTVDGRSIPVRLSASALRDETRGGYLLVAENLTERQRLELELRQAQKMEAIGRLAGGVAHDFNNMLSIILGYTEVLLDGLSEHDPSFDALTEVRQAGQRSAELTTQLLAFSRRQTLEAVVVDVNEVLESTTRMMRRTLGNTIEIKVAPCPRPCRIKSEAGQLDSVLMNLIINARDAMPRGGRLRVSSERVDIDDEHPDRALGLSPGPHVVLRVADSGAGMDSATQSRIFEPFFTTKPQGEGTGLGLATVFGIVRRSGGGVGVESEIGRGTTFRVYFPVIAEGAVSGVMLLEDLRGVA